MKHLSTIVGLLLCGCAAAFAREDPELWRTILGSAQGKIPPADGAPVEWRTDFEAALEEAGETGKPLLVTWRCLPCKQCAEFDKNVLEGSAKLTPLLQRFITVRMTDAAKLDERYFPYRDYQDLDLSWWGYFFSPEGRLYGIFGGKDHVSDATRISEAAFVNTLQRVLAHHYDPRRESWEIDGPIPDHSATASGPRDIDGYEAYAENRAWLSRQECLHCHQVRDIVNVDAMEAGYFDIKSFTQPWPFPENTGIVLDRDNGLLVTKVESGGAGDRAGLKVGDRLGMANLQRLFGQADFRGVLHRAPLGDASLLIGWTRNGEPQFGRLELEDGWRASEIAWRKSVYEGVYGPHLGFFPLKGPNAGKGSLSIRPFMGPGNKVKENEWYGEGLRPSMEIVSINGRTDDWDSRQLLTWLKLNVKEGEKVVLGVRQNGKIIEISRRVRSKH